MANCQLAACACVNLSDKRLREEFKRALLIFICDGRIGVLLELNWRINSFVLGCSAKGFYKATLIN